MVRASAVVVATSMLATWTGLARAQEASKAALQPAPAPSTPSAVPAPASSTPSAATGYPAGYPYPAPGYPAPYPYPYPYPYPQGSQAAPAYQPPSIAVEPEAPPKQTSFSLTLSPALLLAPVLQVTGEARLGTRAGVALIAGGGWVRVTQSDGRSLRFNVLEFGGQLRYYATGTFRRGLQVGVEILYVNVDTKVEGIVGVASGLAIGPFFGWKTTTDTGFTFDLQGGVAVETLGVEVSDSTSTSTKSEVDFVPMANLNIGWSF